MRWLTDLLHAAFPDKTMEVDLHGLRVPEALEVVRLTVAELEEHGSRVRIICGKGRGSPGGVGVLREAVGGWLTAHGYGQCFQRAVDSDGRDGSLMLELPKLRQAGEDQKP